ncbi:hypothetical protein BJX99DRAFT_246160 [Aspergillus californicus]
MSSQETLLTNWPAIYNYTPTAHNESYPFISHKGVTLDKKSVLITGGSRGISRMLQDRRHLPKFGSLDILVNNAGTSDSMVPFLDSNTEEWWGTWEANAKGTSKMGVTLLTEFMATEFGPQGLVAVSIHPRNCPTNLSRRIAPEELHGIAFPETPKLAGDTIMWLGSQRREWLNGRFVSVTWDMKESEEKNDDIVQRDVLKFPYYSLV